MKIVELAEFIYRKLGSDKGSDYLYEVAIRVYEAIHRKKMTEEEDALMHEAMRQLNRVGNGKRFTKEQLAKHDATNITRDLEMAIECRDLKKMILSSKWKENTSGRYTGTMRMAASCRLKLALKSIDASIYWAIIPPKERVKYLNFFKSYPEEWRFYRWEHLPAYVRKRVSYLMNLRQGRINRKVIPQPPHNARAKPYKSKRRPGERGYVKTYR